MPAVQNSDEFHFGESSTLSRRIGLAMALSSTVLGVLYLLGIAVNLVTASSFYPSGEDVRAVSALVALLWNLVLLVLFVALWREAQPSRSIFGELALVFGILVCATSSARWFIGLTSFHRFAQIAGTGMASLLDPYDSASLAYALEHLGWGLFFGLATVCAGAALDLQAASSWLRWCLVATGVLSLGHFLGVLTGNDTLTLLGFISWGIALPLSSALLAGMFQQKLKRIPS